MFRAWQAMLLGLAAASCRIEPPIADLPPPEALDTARQIVARLDTIAADYPAAVTGGKVVDRPRYDEQLGRVADIRKRLSILADLQPELVAADKAGIDLVESRVREIAPGEEVEREARESAGAILERRRLVLAPIAVPDRERARALFSENCAKCHGDRGAGDGPQRAELKVPPRDLTDSQRASTLSMRRVFNTLTDGVPAADMPSFELLSATDRWSLSAFALTLSFVGPDGGEVGTAADEPVGRLALANRTNAELERTLGKDGLAHARTAQTFAPPGGPLGDVAIAVAAAVIAHREGKRPAASDHLDAALAEIVAPLRPGLLARDHRLAWSLETALFALRASVASGNASELEQRAHAVLGLLGPAEAELGELAPVALAGVAGLAALGWIAMLILCGGAAARASGFRRVGRAVNIGWAIAAIAGAATLFVAGGEVDMAAASQRHMLVAVLRGAAAIAGVVTALALLRRLAVPVNRQPAQDADTTPWWLAMVVFAIAYGGALEVTGHIAQIAAATGASKLSLLGAAVVVVGAVAALLRLLAEARRRLGDAPFFGIAAIAALVASVAAAGQAVHVLYDIGVAEPALGAARRFDPLALYPNTATAGAQLAIAALVAGGAVFLLISRRAGLRGDAAAS